MSTRDERTSTVRLIGLVSSFIAVAAIGITVLARSTMGLGHSFNRTQQFHLLCLAAALCIANILLYLIDRKRRRQHRADQASVREGL